MHYNTAMITFFVGANALKLNSRLETEDIWSDALDFVVDTGTNIGEGFVDVAETLGQGIVDAGEYIIFADGLADDLETFGKTVTSAEFWEEDMKNVAEDLFLVDDVFNWMADGSNWEALGKVMLGTGVSLINGDFDQAANIVTNWDLYTGQGWDDIETMY